MNEFEKLERLLRDLNAEEARIERKKKNLAEWSDPAAKRAYIAEYKRKKRDAAIPQPRVCPCCREARPNSRQWVVFPRAKLAGVTHAHATRVRETFPGRSTYAVCRHCAMSYFLGILWKAKK